MSRLATAATARIRSLVSDLTGYTALLRDRPAELPEFVAYMETTWQHLQVWIWCELAGVELLVYLYR